MAELKVYRNKRSTNEDMEKLITYVWEEEQGNIIDKSSKGVATATSKAICDSFLLVQEARGGCNNVKMHCCEIEFDEGVEKDKVKEVVGSVRDYIGNDYQCIAVTREDNNIIKACFVINAVSFNTGKKFSDNNAAYIKAASMIKAACGSDVTLKLDDSVLFKNVDNNRDNYITKSGGK